MIELHCLTALWIYLAIGGGLSLLGWITSGNKCPFGLFLAVTLITVPVWPLAVLGAYHRAYAE